MNLKAGISGSVDQWISGSVDQWISGSVDQWISGSLDEKTHEKKRAVLRQKKPHGKPSNQGPHHHAQEIITCRLPAFSKSVQVMSPKLLSMAIYVPVLVPAIQSFLKTHTLYNLSTWPNGKFG